MKVLGESEYCRRTNLNNVDLNRNWDYNHNKRIELPEEENPGPKPFSETETQFLKFILEQFKAHIYLTVHSGAYGLYHPYAFSEKDDPNIKNYKEIKSALMTVKEKFCHECDVGLAYTYLKYVSSGTSADYAYDKEKLNIPIASIIEIFDGEYYDNRGKFRFKSVARRTKTRTFLKQIDEVS
jgi:hypothetical protein